MKAKRYGIRTIGRRVVVIDKIRDRQVVAIVHATLGSISEARRRARLMAAQLEAYGYIEETL